MNLFQIINHVLYKSSSTQVEDLDQEGRSAFSAYMTTRWVSFYDKGCALFANDTLNKFHSIFDDSNDTYKLFCNMTPKRRFKKIAYVKKPKTAKEKVKEENLDIGVIAKNHELSKREVAIYLEMLRS